jgi:16S rRNA (uracil1498-N3)-methyltransferase
MRSNARLLSPRADVNIVLIESAEAGCSLSLGDPRAHHIRKVLRREVGDSFDIGCIDGPRGKATLTTITESALRLQIDWAQRHAPPPPTTLIVGFPRPQTARDILRDATTLGATGLHFVATARSDPNYPRSSLWHQDEWRRHVIQGAAQAFDTFTPRVSWDADLTPAAASAQAEGYRLIGLDVYGDHPNFAALQLNDPQEACALLIGPERGWDERDRAVLAETDVEWVGLGHRVLRTETAAVAGLALLNAARARV